MSEWEVSRTISAEKLNEILVKIMFTRSKEVFEEVADIEIIHRKWFGTSTNGREVKTAIKIRQIVDDEYNNVAYYNIMPEQYKNLMRRYKAVRCESA
jgi:hypothetical protein